MIHLSNVSSETLSALIAVTHVNLRLLTTGTYYPNSAQPVKCHSNGIIFP